MSTQQSDMKVTGKGHVSWAAPAKIPENHSGYVSEFDLFLNAFLEEHPDVIREQRKGWKIYWDKKVDLDEQKMFEEDALPMPPYQHD